jgi:hypothetical protein
MEKSNKDNLRLLTIRQLAWYQLFCYWGYEAIAKELEEEEEEFLNNRYKYIEQEQIFRKDYRGKKIELEKELGQDVCNQLLKDFLNNELKAIEDKINKAYENMNEQRRKHIPFWIRKAYLNYFFYVPKLEIEKKKLEHKLSYLNFDNTNTKKFTPEQIKMAEERNPEDFLDFNYAGFCICPFHEEKTPSMKYYKDTLKFHCYGCGWHGNMIDFIMQRDNINFVDAIKRLTNQ